MKKKLVLLLVATIVIFTLSIQPVSADPNVPPVGFSVQAEPIIDAVDDTDSSQDTEGRPDNNNKSANIERILNKLIAKFFNK